MLGTVKEFWDRIMALGAGHTTPERKFKKEIVRCISKL